MNAWIAFFIGLALGGAAGILTLMFLQGADVDGED